MKRVELHVQEVGRLDAGIPVEATGEGQSVPLVSVAPLRGLPSLVGIGSRRGPVAAGRPTDLLGLDSVNGLELRSGRARMRPGMTSAGLRSP